MWDRKWPLLVLFLVGTALTVPCCVEGEQSPAKSESPTADTPAAGEPSEAPGADASTQVAYKGSCGHIKTQAAGLPAPSC